MITVEFPIEACIQDTGSAGCQDLIHNIHNPYYIGDQPGLTQTLGWVDAWVSKPSVYAVAASNADHIAAAVNFARENNLRLVVKGGGHSYQGTSNAADSLLVWTRRMHDITMHETFVAQGCEGRHAPQRAVTLGSGAIWMQVYDAVTTKGGAYVQGGGCTTVGVAGLVQSGGFGSFSKHYGTAAAGLLEAEVVTADGKVLIANACTNPDLFWALKGGGGGTFGAVSKVTLRVRELPEFWGAAILRVKAASDDAFRRLVRYFVGFYRENLFNDHWGEQARIASDNVLDLVMVCHDLSTGEVKKTWQPFLDWVARSPAAYTIEGQPILGSMPARHWWDVEWRKQNHQAVLIRTRGRARVQTTRGGQETRGKWPGSFTDTNRCGCRRRCSKMIAGAARAGVVLVRATRTSSCIQQRAGGRAGRGDRDGTRYRANPAVLNACAGNRGRRRRRISRCARA